MIKELIVVLFIAGATFLAARPLASQFMDPGDFRRRRNVWLILTTLAFLAPNYWIFILIAAPILFWAGRQDNNPIALYLLVLPAIPVVEVPLPAIGVNALFDLDFYRLLAFCILLPTAIRFGRSTFPSHTRGLNMMDYLLLGFGLLQVIFYVRPDLAHASLADLNDSLTNTLRRAFLYFLDVYLLYFAVSRSCRTQQAIQDAMACFCLTGVILALTGAFETARNWLLYTDLITRWGGNVVFSGYMVRAGILRAQASAGDPLALGYWCAVGFGFWLYLRPQITLPVARYGIAIALWLGLLAAYSRGPWLGAIAIYFAYAALRPNALSGILKAAVAATVALAALLVSPLGSKIISVLPFMGGSVDSGSLTYRQALAQRSWEIIVAHPFLGDQFVFSKLEDLRQGQGIIDLVNTYIEITLFYGLIGLGLFMAFALTALARAYRTSRAAAQPKNPRSSILGASLIACLVGTLVMLADCSFILDYQKIFYVLAAVAVSYASFARVRRPIVERARPRGPKSAIAPVRRVRFR